MLWEFFGVPSELRKRCLSFVAQYIACGINPDKNDIIIQSHNSHHAELMWVLSCFTYQGELSRMTQYKSKSKNLKNINTQPTNATLGISRCIYVEREIDVSKGVS